MLFTTTVDLNGVMIISDTIEKAFDIANSIAPEHLCIMVRSPKRYLELVKAAGSVFLGDFSPVAAGDYCTGPNHILPTGGQARDVSGLSVADFYKRIYYQHVSKDELRRLRRTLAMMTKVEGLDAHMRSIDVRLSRSNGQSKENGKERKGQVKKGTRDAREEE